MSAAWSPPAPPGTAPFVSRDHRSTFVIVALQATPGDSAGALVQPVRDLVKATMAQVPDGPRYRVRVTGRAPLDLDVRTVVGPG
jgi:MMPL family.